MTPMPGFRVAMLLVGALYFYQADVGRTVLPKWPLWANLFYSVFNIMFQSLGGHASARHVSHKPPNPTCARSYIWGFPKILEGGNGFPPF